MSEILGLIDSIEATILEAKKLPFSNKIILEEKKLLNFVDKLRFLIKNQDKDAARQAIDQSKKELISGSEDIQVNINSSGSEDKSDEEITSEATKKAEEIKTGANDYADNILARLQLMVTKLQKNIIRLEKNIDEGRMLISEKQKKSMPEEVIQNENK